MLRSATVGSYKCVFHVYEIAHLFSEQLSMYECALLICSLVRLAKRVKITTERSGKGPANMAGRAGLQPPNDTPLPRLAATCRPHPGQGTSTSLPALHLLRRLSHR